MPKVYNKRGIYPFTAVYIGRPTKWGNPFIMGKDGSRSEVINKYAVWLLGSGLDIEELRGKDLACWCAPLPCHGDVLLGLLEATEKRKKTNGLD